MVKPLLFFLAAATLSNAAVTDAMATANNVFFLLCPANVERIAVFDSNEDAIVEIELTPAAAEELVLLTRRHKGSMLSLMAGDLLLSRAIIRAVVDSGRLRSTVLSPREARQLKAFLENESNVAACGAR